MLPAWRCICRWSWEGRDAVELSLKWRISVALAAVATAWLIGLTSAGADPPPPAEGGRAQNALCLSCHDHKLTVGANTSQERTVDSVQRQGFDSSAHKGMACVDCHAAESALPHVQREGPGLPNASGALACRECHSDAYEGFMDGHHGTMVNLGDDRAPTCSDCHGNTHYLPFVQQWTVNDRAEACAECHSGATTSFLNAAPGHKSASSGFLSTPYFAGILLTVLTTATLAFGIIHVELEMLSLARPPPRPGTRGKDYRPWPHKLVDTSRQSWRRGSGQRLRTQRSSASTRTNASSTSS